MWSVIDANKSKCDIIAEDGTVFGHVKTCESKEEASKKAEMIKHVWPDIELKGFKVKGGFDLFAAYYEYYDNVVEKTIKPPPGEDVPPGDPTVDWEEEESNEEDSWDGLACRLGINGLDREHALDLLEEHGVNLVFDVRWNTFFKSKQGFGPDGFKHAAKKRGITHYYVKSLGNPFHGKDLDPIVMKAKYMKFLDEWCWHHYPSGKDYFPRKKIDKIKKVLEKGLKVCFICYCKYPDPCHTYWILEKLLGHSIHEEDHALRALVSKTLTSS
jgi:hypothetical protein